MTHITPAPGAAIASTPDGTTAPGRKANITLWALQILMAAAFVIAAITKFSRYPAAVQTFDQIGFGDWFMYLIATLELAGAVGLVIPILSGLSGLALTGLLTGAVLT